ncbi:MAG: transporter ATP-binding protein, partial [Devosia sp.]|nr:transporter ATP-binding protein [Devosia sp.]
MGEKLFEIRDLSIDTTRGGVTRRIVENMNLAVERGQIYGLVGESGSGKSISMMASVGLAAPGLLVSRSGEVSFGGKRLAAADQKGLRG